MAGKHYGIDVMAAGKTRWLALQSFLLGLAFFSTFHPSLALATCVCGEWVEGGGGGQGEVRHGLKGNSLRNGLGLGMSILQECTKITPLPRNRILPPFFMDFIVFLFGSNFYYVTNNQQR